MTNSDEPIVGIPLGDPGGVGCEVFVKSFREDATNRYIAIGNIPRLRRAIEICGLDYECIATERPRDVEFSNKTIYAVNLNGETLPPFGSPSRENGRASLKYIETGVELVRKGKIDALAGAPVSGESIEKFTGGPFGDWFKNEFDTEFKVFITMERLTVSHVSSHVSLREAIELASKENVIDTLRVTYRTLEKLGQERPTMAVAGLNPHASDGGLLGNEERDQIAPAVKECCDQGMDVVGPESPDTVFVRALNDEFDCVVAMYHDQGHIPFKTLAMRDDIQGAAILMKAPVPYATPNHGTAFDIAGQGEAGHGSMLKAMQLAHDLAK